MNKNKIYTILGIAILMAACQDDPVTIEGIKVVPGEEIQFGATAYFEDGDAKTRTEYGTISGNKIEVNWVAGEDKLQIASPHTAGVEVAEYQVSNVSSSEDENGDDIYVDKSKATTLQRIGDAGLQWTNNMIYEFYAMYPSHNQLKEVVTEVADVENYGLKTSVDADGNQMGSMTGYLPVRQDPKSEDIPTSPDADNTYVIKPDMRYAYMVAKAYYTVPDDGVIDSEEEKIQLPFSSLVTALQFQLKANEIGVQTDGTQQITITALTLFSASGADICGKFKYTYPQGTSVDVLTDGTFETLNDATGYNQVIMEFGDGITLTKDQSVDATFFLLPSVEKYAAEDLKLTVHFKVAGQPQVRTAIINRDLTPKKKYYFRNLLLPVIPAGLEGSSWWSALDSNTLFSQVSIPVAGNVFSNSYTGSDATYHKEQILDYQTLWNLGVRGFELVTGYGAEGTGETVENLGDTYFVCGEKVLSSGIKFAEAFETLASFAESGSGYEDETLVLICKYHAVDDPYSPQDYVTELIEYLEEFVAGNEYGLTKDNFVRINTNTTVGDLMGNIAIIIRPGDDDYMKWIQSTHTHTSSIDMGDWADNLMLVQNWGAAYDRWDKRYSGYTREATWGKVIGDGKLCVEDSLYSFGASGDTYASLEAYDYGGSFSTGAWQKSANTDNTSLFAHTLTNYSGVAYVQEWARVVPQSYDNVPLKYTNEDPSNGYTLWFKWPESITEKKTQIDKLFTASVATKGGSSTGDLFINVLSGYYITTNHQKSIAPFNQTFIAGTEEVVGRYTPKIADTEDEAEACYIRFQGSGWYIYNGSTTALNASSSAQGNSSEWKLIGTGTGNFILKNNVGYYVSGISGDYVQVSTNSSSAATLRLIDNVSTNLSPYWDIEFVDVVGSNGYSRFNQFEGTGGTSVGVWASDAGCAVYFEPCNGTPEGTTDSDGTVRTDALRWSPAGQGNGGNYAALAADLNSYVYGILSGTQNLSSTSAKLPEGPWGLVVIDYIGATQDEFTTYGAGEFVSDLSSAATASSKLVDLIMMNNFKFPLALKASGGTSSGGNGDETDEDDSGTETSDVSVTFSETSADPSNSIR